MNQNITKAEILERFSGLKTWKSGGERAPHKPLLLLLALGKCRNNGQRLLKYSDIEADLKDLLICFGPYRKSIKTEQPFWRLTSDKLWEIPDKKLIAVNCSGDPSRRELIEQGIQGGLKEEVYIKLSSDDNLFEQVVENLLQENFPETYHDDIRLATGLLAKEACVVKVIPCRDSGFRNRILTIYQYRCAVCGFELRLGGNSICLEAAHIMWHQAGGPPTEQNGLALCSLHHKMFDRGVFAIDSSRRVIVSELTNGQSSAEWVYRYKGKEIFLPFNNEYHPSEKFIQWHFKEVFKPYSPKSS